MAKVVNYFYERRRGFAKAASVLGGLYVAGSYVARKLENMRDVVLEERTARDNLRRRFQQNQQDASYMVLGLIPTLAVQVLEGMDVEALTQELQQKSKTVKSTAHEAPVQPLMPNPPPASLPEAPLTDSIISNAELVNLTPQESDARSDSELGESGSVVSIPVHERETPSGSSFESTLDLSKSSQSWVDEFTSQSASPVPPPGSAKPSVVMPAPPSVLSEPPASLSSSVSSLPSTSTRASSRTKAELWNEVKILTFTRTFTVLYSTTLLSLFTHIQLSILGRIKYVQSVFDIAKEERARDGFELSSMSVLASQLGLPSLGQKMKGSSFNTSTAHEVPTEVGDEEWGNTRGAGGVARETEMQYLSLSWWLLHVGWKDIGERVRRAVEEVFNEVSLKEKLSAMDLHRLLSDVRRRVEHEVTFEGKERRINFLSSLLPPSQETLHHVLTKAGLSVAPPPHLHLPTFNYAPVPGASGESGALGALLSETRARLAAPDFAVVLSAALDLAAGELGVGLESNVFPTGEDVSLEDTKVRLAGMLPGLARWSKLAITGLPNELVDRLGDVPEVGTYSAIIYSAFEEKFR